MDKQFQFERTLPVAGITWGIREISEAGEFFRHLSDLVTRAHNQGAELVVLPELYEVELLALFGDGHEQEVVDKLLPFCDAIDDALSNLAKTLSIYIVGGSLIRPSSSGAVNISSVAWPSGEIFLQPKNALTGWEKNEWHLASEKGITRFPDSRLGVLVCYDSEFPEASRAIAEAGTEVLCVPSYTETQHGFQRVNWCCRARSVENELFVIQTSLVGPIGRFSLGTGYGRSTIIAPSKQPFPDSAVLAESALNEEGIAVATLDFDALTASRASGDARPWADRRCSSWHLRN